MNHEQIESALNWRFATKKFDATKKIDAKDWRVLEDSLVKTPTSYGLQPYKFIVVQNADLREKLKAASWNQTQVTDCSHYVVFVYKKKMDAEHVQKYINRVAEVRGVALESLDGYKKTMLGDVVNGPRAEVINWWAQRQAYIAMGFLLETAALLQVDACPMEGLDAGQYDKILDLEGSSWATVASVALGYRHSEDPIAKQKKVRFANSDLIIWK
jgi:nitroreductase